jgi:hypothetical protein
MVDSDLGFWMLVALLCFAQSLVLPLTSIFSSLLSLATRDVDSYSYPPPYYVPPACDVYPVGTASPYQVADRDRYKSFQTKTVEYH